MGYSEAAMGTLDKKIFILHGWSYSTEKWRPFIQQLKQRGFEPNILPIPGLTASLNTPWKLDDYVNWLDANINHPSIILAHSNGGRIALAFTAAYPQKVRQLILIDSAGIHHFNFKRIIFWLLAKLGQPLKRFKILRKLVYLLVGERDYLKASPILRQTMINLSSDLTPILSRISVPTLIIWGSQDKITPLSDGQTMHRLIENSTLHTVAAARHSPQFTHPEAVVQSVSQFLNS